MSAKPGNRQPEFITGTGIATGAGTGIRIGKETEVGFNGREKKDEINDHILLRNKK